MRSKLLLPLLLVGHVAAALGAPAQNPQRDAAAALPGTLRGMRAALDPLIVAGRADTSGLAVRTGSGAVIDAASVVAEAPVASLMELVQARVPGVSVFQAPGVPGGAAQIRIRGVHSVVGDGGVAVYVDGIPVDAAAVSFLDTGNLRRAGIAGIAPEDIASVEVLKGSTSTLWYGPAAAGGAILVTTRKASPGARGFTQRIVLEHGPVDPGAELPANWVRCGDDPTGACAGQPPDMILSDRPLERDGMLGGGTASTVHWSGRGSTDRLGVYGSLGWTRDDGLLPTTGFDRRSARAGLRLRAAETVDVEVGLGASAIETDLPITGSTGSGGRNLVVHALRGNPTTVGASKDGWGIVDGDSLLDIEASADARRYRPRVRLVHRAAPWLTHSLHAGADLARDEAFRRAPHLAGAGMSLELLERKADLYTVDYRARFDARRLGAGRHDLELLLGVQATWDRREESIRSGSEGAVGDIDPERSYSILEIRREREAVGVVADARYGYRDRLFTELGVRRDRLDDIDGDAGRLFSYRLGAAFLAYDGAARRAPIPGVDIVRVRAAVGGAELDRIIPVADFSFGLYGDPLASSPGGKERLTEAELGVDAGLLDGRVGLAVTAFRRTTRDVAFLTPRFDDFAGLWSWGGRAELRNRGVEVALAAELLRADDISWSARLSASRLANEVAELNAPWALVDGWHWMLEGRPAGSFHSRSIIEVEGAGGRVLVTDTLEYAGSPIPEWEGALETGLSLWGRLRLRALLDGHTGFDVYNQTAQWRDRGYRNSERYARRDALAPEERALYTGEYVDSNGAVYPLDVPAPYIRDGSFLWLREVSATLELPRTWVARIGASGAALTVAGRNVALWSRYDGVDPEFPSWSAPLSRRDWFVLPQSARWSVRLAVQF
ncbi:MAG TPA: TonB-dependent receptor [Longimicrobiales bacterium]